METLIPRGIRNNNPLNIRISDDAWQGRVSALQQTDKAFLQFISFYYGFRAAMKTIRTYVLRYNRKSIRQIITRWAPESDGNNTEGYIKTVCRLSGYDEFYQIPTKSGGEIANIIPLFRIAAAMAVVESTKRVWMDAERRNMAIKAMKDLAQELKLQSLFQFDEDMELAFLDHLTSPNLLSSSPEGQSSFNNHREATGLCPIAKQSSPKS